MILSNRRRTSAKPAAPVPAPNAGSEKYRTYAVADARAKLAEIFDHVTAQQARCYVRAGDPKKTKFLTFDYQERHMVEPIMDITINSLKSHFATYSAFVRLGACFRVTRRTSNQPVFLRRFTRYTDPLDAVMTEYIEGRTRKAVEDALNARPENGIEKALIAIRHAQENDTAAVLEEIKKVSTGIGRMAVNRHPFRDVPLRKDVNFLGDDDD